MKYYTEGMPYVLIKHGMYYGHNNCGYVGRIEMAEIYNKGYAQDYAEGHDNVIAVPVSDYLNPDSLCEYVIRMEAMRDALLEALEEEQ